jgi:hypothetical protein
MKDMATKEPLRVSPGGKAGPYLIVPFSQLAALQRLLDQHSVAYTVEEEVISLNEGPEEAMVNLGRSGDSQQVQKILDSVD